MTSSNIKKTIFEGDNLPILRGLNSDLVDLIYLDPPFNSNQSFSAPIGSQAAGASFKDAWHLTDIDITEHELLKQTRPDLYHSILGSKYSHSDSMFSYLLFMANRLIECHRILKPTGSLYLHCDPYASHYLKQLLDTIFGRKNFRNEIVWQMKSVSGFKSQKNGWIRDHDVIFYYVKDRSKFKFNKQFKPYSQKYIDKMFKRTDKDGRKYRQRPNKRYYADEGGIPFGDVYDDIYSLQTTTRSKEITKYPTQKPLKLLERIIKASSNPGDLVLDPFCGCATTCVAADYLGRNWIGIDISDKAIELVRDRIRDRQGLFEDITHSKELPLRTDIGKQLTAREKKDYKQVLYGGQEGYCNGCKTHFEIRHFEIDHIIPRIKGGTDHKQNFQLLCSNCNRKKGSKTQAQFVRELEELRV